MEEMRIEKQKHSELVCELQRFDIVQLLMSLTPKYNSELGNKIDGIPEGIFDNYLSGGFYMEWFLDYKRVVKLETIDIWHRYLILKQWINDNTP